MGEAGGLEEKLRDTYIPIRSPGKHYYYFGTAALALQLYRGVYGQIQRIEDAAGAQVYRSLHPYCAPQSQELASS